MPRRTSCFSTDDFLTNSQLIANRWQYLLYFIIKPADILNISIHCVTFHQPLYECYRHCFNREDEHCCKIVWIPYTLKPLGLNWIHNAWNWFRGFVWCAVRKNLVENVMQDEDYKRAARGYFEVRWAQESRTFYVLLNEHCDDSKHKVCICEPDSSENYGLDPEDVQILTDVHKVVTQTKIWLTYRNENDCKHFL